MKRTACCLALGLILTPLAAAAEAEPEWLVKFSNGDQLSGALEELAEGKLTLSTRFAPELPVEVDMIRSISRVATEPLPDPPGPFRVRLRDGSILNGEVEELTDTVLVFTIPEVASLSIRRDRVRSVVRVSQEGERVPPLRGEEHIVTTLNGSRLQGRLEQEDGSLVVAGEGLWKGDLDVVAAIDFPRGVTTPGEGPPAESRLHLRDGSTLIGAELGLQAGTFSLRTPDDQRVEIPVAMVDTVENLLAQAEAATPEQRVVVWGRYSDEDEELENTIEALAEELGPGWEVVPDRSETFVDEFADRLFEASALVIAEMEEFEDHNLDELALELWEIAPLFLSGGGRIVVLHPWLEALDFLSDSGLVEIEEIGDYVDDLDELVRIRSDDPSIRGGLPDEIDPINATRPYVLGEETPMETWADVASREGVVFAGRKVLNGWVILLGADYFERNPDFDRMLANAVRLAAPAGAEE